MSATTKHPHVLILMCDQMQAQRVSWLDATAHTPQLNQLAQESVRFSHAMTCQGQCVPARAAFMTGQYAHECGVMTNYGFEGHTATLGPQHLTLGHAFKAEGYQTAYFGKTHFGVPLESLGFDDTFDSVPVAVSDTEAEARDIAYVPAALRRDYVAIDEAEKYLRAYEPADEPLFFTFSTNLPHPPFFAEREYIDRFPAAEMTIPASYYDEDFTRKPPYQKEHAEDGRHGAGDEDTLREMMAQYYSMIAVTDEHCGRIIAQFKQLGMWENTVVLFIADHGDMMGAHGMQLKGTLPYDELYRVPCLLKLPAGVTPARTDVDDLVSSVECAGTLLRAAGITPPAAFSNGDFYDVMFRDEAAADQAIFFEHYAAYWGLHPFYGIRTPTHKYVRYYGADDTEELYDIVADPHELRNLAEAASHAERQRELSTRADQWWRDTGGQDATHYESVNFKANTHNVWAE